MGEVATRDHIEVTNIELWGIYNVLRDAYLNVLYYGKMTARWSRRNLWLQVGASVGSLSAVTGFLASGTSLAGDNQFWWKLAAGIVGVVSALCAALPSLMGLADRIGRCERLHFSYNELFQLAKLASMNVRREGLISSEQVGSAKLLGDISSRLGQQDIPGIDKKLRAECEAEVRTKYDEKSLWYASGHGNQGPKSTTAPTTRTAS